jgi:hypothetical protein
VNKEEATNIIATLIVISAGLLEGDADAEQQKKASKLLVGVAALIGDLEGIDRNDVVALTLKTMGEMK